MSPKQTTKLAFIVGGISILGVIIMLVIQPEWGALTWWPAMGLGLSLLLLVISFLKGAYMSAQKRVALADMLNDCYSGNTEVD